MFLRKVPLFLLSVMGCAVLAASSQAQGVRGFGTPPGKLPLRGFGNPVGEEALRAQFPEAAAAIVGDDRSLARSQISRTDANGDGIVTAKEWAESGFSTPRHFYYHDLNGDGILTLYEHSIGVARWRRRNERRADNRLSREFAARKQAKAVESSPILPTPPPIHPQVEARREQTRRLAEYLLSVYDTNGDNFLERSEFQSSDSPFGHIASADQDRNGRIQSDEIMAWLQRRLPPLSQLARELQSRDLDRDGQVALSEFAPNKDDATIEEFHRWDRNRDGFITPRESRVPLDSVVATYENKRAAVLKPSTSMVSTITIAESGAVGRLKVYVKLTKENDNYTELLLVGPEGTRVPLYAGNGWVPWRGASILDGVTFDDQAPAIRGTLKQPPIERQLQPPGTGDRTVPGLDAFRGQAKQGTWRLIVRNQNERVGLLVQWALIVIPGEQDE